MAKNTPNALRGSMIYCIYPRAYEGGTFNDIRAGLSRIKALGADILWLLPIHPTGLAARKGSLGSPYAIRDYRAVNPEYGTLEDFKALLAAAHGQGLRVIIDVVYNHTSPDSVLAEEHPEWFYRAPDGSFGNRAGEWSDVIDLDYANPGLWEYQIQTLEYWAGLGVDGFRCDVASLVPVAFWSAARARVEAVRPGAVWLAESVHTGFLEAQREAGFAGWSDGELYEAFDITYDYDIHDHFAACHAGACKTSGYLAAMRRQQSLYPQNFLKLRFLENHDQPRAAALLPEKARMDMWTAFMLFVRGTALVYAGQEARCIHTPSLFEREPVDFTGTDAAYCALVARLAALRQEGVLLNGRYSLREGDAPGVALARYVQGGRQVVGVFNLDGAAGSQPVGLPDGVYENLAGGPSVAVLNGEIPLGTEPVILRGA